PASPRRGPDPQRKTSPARPTSAVWFFGSLFWQTGGHNSMTKTKTTIYWASTLFVAFIMTISGTLALIHAPTMMTALAHLGYPPYFSTLLAVSNLAGVSVLLLPGIARLKEWAYAGFGI